MYLLYKLNVNFSFCGLFFQRSKILSRFIHQHENLSKHLFSVIMVNIPLLLTGHFPCEVGVHPNPDQHPLCIGHHNWDT